MTASRQAWLAALLVPAVMICGLTGAVVANAESVSQVRVAQAKYADAWDQAVSVHERADSALRDAASLALRADQLLYTAHTYQSLAHLDADSLAALIPLVEALESALAVELPADPALPAQLQSASPADLAAETDELKEWTDSVGSDWAAVPPSDVPETLEALDSGLHAVARDVATVGAALLASKGGASAETRAALTDALEAVAESIADDGPTFAAVTGYVVAAQAVVDSQAAADAAAAAAASSGGGSGGGTEQPEVLAPWRDVIYAWDTSVPCAVLGAQRGWGADHPFYCVAPGPDGPIEF